jgi:hypothetical protein
VVGHLAEATRIDALWEAWRAEASPTARPALLLALGHADPGAAAPVLGACLYAAEPFERLAAAVAIGRAGLPFPDGAATAIAEAAGGEPRLPWWWQRRRAEGLSDLVDHDVSLDFLADLVTACVAGSAPAAEAACYLVQSACERRRSAGWRLLPLLEPLLRGADPDMAQTAAWTVSDAGESAATVVDLLSTPPRHPVSPLRSTVSDPEIETLALLGDPRWVEPSCKQWAAGRTPFHCDPRDTPAVRVAVAAQRATTARGGAVEENLAGIEAEWARRSSPPVMLAEPWPATPPEPGVEGRLDLLVEGWRNLYGQPSLASVVEACQEVLRPGDLPALMALADRDERIVRGGVLNWLTWWDDELRHTIRAAARILSATRDLRFPR